MERERIHYTGTAAVYIHSTELSTRLSLHWRFGDTSLHSFVSNRRVVSALRGRIYTEDQCALLQEACLAMRRPPMYRARMMARGERGREVLGISRLLVVPKSLLCFSGQRGEGWYCVWSACVSCMYPRRKTVMRLVCRAIDLCWTSEHRRRNSTF